MPLQLGDDTTQRPELITYDPDSEAQSREAEARADELLRARWRLGAKAPGKISLLPPLGDPNFGLFRILTKNGDDRVVWDRRDPAQVKEAYGKFKEFITKGYTAYAVRARGQRGHRITDFDPGLQEILFVPATMPG